MPRSRSDGPSLDGGTVAATLESAAASTFEMRGLEQRVRDTMEKHPAMRWDAAVEEIVRKAARTDD